MNETTNETTVVYYHWPSSNPNVQALGWLLPASSVLLIPVIGIWQWQRRSRKGKSTGKAMFRPTKNWKPAIDTSASLENLVENYPRTDAVQRQISSISRGSRMSFRKHLPPNAFSDCLE